MKATLEFSLPEEREEYELTSNAGKYHSALWDLREAIRQVVKYGTDEAKVTAWEEVQEMFFRVLEDNEVSLK
jgi:hypothetical protein